MPEVRIQKDHRGKPYPLTQRDRDALRDFRRLLEARAMDCQKLEADGTQCKRTAKWKPSLMVRPFVGCEPATIEVNLSICDHHKAESVAESFLSDQGWEKIADMFAALRKAIPVRNLTELDWRLIQ